ncbi:MAG: 6-carboxytetrahydropterin synthase [Phycisphaerales bacterium]
MFAITVEHEFCAAHALVIAGAREPIHGHNFHVWLTVEGPGLDNDGLLCDFHTIQQALRDATEPFTNRNLHDCPSFTSKNPTAENIARCIADEVSSRVGPSLAPHARVTMVRVSEAPGCVATYTP